MSLELNPEVEKIVREQAAAEGLSVDDLLWRTYAGGEPASGSVKRVRALLAEWQDEDVSPASPPTRDPDAETSSADLFARWSEEDQTMSLEEREIEDRLWVDVEQGIEETRARLGMRPLTR